MGTIESIVQRKEGLKRYILAADLLPEALWQAAFSIPEDKRLKAEEFRLREGRPMTLTVDGQIVSLPNTLVQQKDLEAVVAKVSRCSLHSHDAQLRQGFLTAKGGHRVGLCGVYTDTTAGKIPQSITSVNIRIARQVMGIGDALTEQLFPCGRLCGVLLLSSPGVGKTTLLRDLCRKLSYRFRLSVADCRFELAGDGFNLGLCDVLQGGQKSECIDLLLRSMSPQIIAVDEITAEEDVQALVEAGHVGVSFLATAHGNSIEVLSHRPLYRQLMDAGIFEKIVLLERTETGRAYRIYERRENDDQNPWAYSDRYILLDDGAVDGTGDGNAEKLPQGAYSCTTVDSH